jgi:hypothetical protein
MPWSANPECVIVTSCVDYVGSFMAVENLELPDTTAPRFRSLSAKEKRTGQTADYA